ncbi:MAG: septal ring lytic transglycosylase RlpA family protein [Chitinispirillaceae bacterium]
MKFSYLISAVVILIFSCVGEARYTGSSSASGKKTEAKNLSPNKTNKGIIQTGKASWYGKKFHGRKTANGEIFDMHELTAAHNRLPFNTKVRVTNLDNNLSVIVRINDRGPFSGNRIIDLSYAAAKKLNMVKSGLATVSIEIISP